MAKWNTILNPVKINETSLPAKWNSVPFLRTVYITSEITGSYYNGMYASDQLVQWKFNFSAPLPTNLTMTVVFNNQSETFYGIPQGSTYWYTDYKAFPRQPYGYYGGYTSDTSYYVSCDTGYAFGDTLADTYIREKPPYPFPVYVYQQGIGTYPTYVDIQWVVQVEDYPGRDQLDFTIHWTTGIEFSYTMYDGSVYLTRGERYYRTSNSYQTDNYYVSLSSDFAWDPPTMPTYTIPAL